MKRYVPNRPGRKLLFLLLTALGICRGAVVFAAPLESGFALAPRESASPQEAAAAFREARFKVLAAAGKYEKTPYRYGGLDWNGLDCSGLVYRSFRDALGVSVPRSTASLYSWAETIPAEKIQPGDLLFFRTTNTGQISHVGIYVGGGRFIHAASEGPVTGVIYSSLDEKYWARTCAGAGRVLPEAGINDRSITGPDNAAITASTAPPDKPEAAETSKKKTAAPNVKKNTARKQENGLLLGLAAAPTWNSFLSGGNIIRGVAGQIRLGAAVSPLNQPMIFGLELRPEWDGTLGVFRLPVTLSWGVNDKFRIFAGPAVSTGGAALSTNGEVRRYSGGTRWFGAAGITAAPFALKIASGELAPYGELAWQSYFSDNKEANPNADFAAGFRFSTGLRYTWRP
ncbi:MAG: C40 family peptidase [Treponema sp.]|jgi:probable lipoprotein NlpC|nr:C40 family peptidase [Treponema sp.]